MSPTPFPWWVRALAVLHVLSAALGKLGFFLFMGIACVFGVKRSGVDWFVVTLGLIGLACPLLGELYRKWFEWFGRRHWPTGHYDPPDSFE